MHHFRFGDVMYGVPAPDDQEMNDGRKVQLWTLVDDGEPISLRLRRWLVLHRSAGSRRPDDPKVVYPRLVEAPGGPPEHVRPWGYGGFLEAIADRTTSVTRNRSYGAAATWYPYRLALLSDVGG
jgi:hypothetical protein